MKALDNIKNKVRGLDLVKLVANKSKQLDKIELHLKASEFFDSDDNDLMEQQRIVLQANNSMVLKMVCRSQEERQQVKLHNDKLFSELGKIRSAIKNKRVLPETLEAIAFCKQAWSSSQGLIKKEPVIESVEGAYSIKMK